MNGAPTCSYLKLKDAYDLVYVNRYTSSRGDAIAERLRAHAERHDPLVQDALALLARDFNDADGLGPRRAAELAVVDDTELDAAAADFVDDLLRACRQHGLSGGEESGAGAAS